MPKQKQPVNLADLVAAQDIVFNEGALVFKMRPWTIGSQATRQMMTDALEAAKAQPLLDGTLEDHFDELAYVAVLLSRTIDIVVDLKRVPGYKPVQTFWERYQAGESLVELAEFYIAYFPGTVHNQWSDAESAIQRGLTDVADLAPELLSREEQTDPKSSRPA